MEVFRFRAIPVSICTGNSVQDRAAEVLMGERLTAHFTVGSTSLYNWMAVALLVVLISIVFG
jgi:hypothetical protein